jgi:hypothetical protein
VVQLTSFTLQSSKGATDGMGLQLREPRATRETDFKTKKVPEQNAGTIMSALAAERLHGSWMCQVCLVIIITVNLHMPQRSLLFLL